MKARRIAFIGIFSGISFVLMLLEMYIPLVPAFIKFDISDLPAILLSFAYGPLAGVLVCLVKNILHLLVTHTAGIGELTNFLMGAVFVTVSGLIYQFHKDKKGAIIACVCGSLAMAIVAFPINLFISYPFYADIYGLDQIIGLCQQIIPWIDGYIPAILIFNVPFTFFKGIIASLITFFIYKPLSPLLKGEKIKQTNTKKLKKPEEQ